MKIILPLLCLAALMTAACLFFLAQGLLLPSLVAHIIEGICGYYCVAATSQWRRSKLLDFSFSFLVPGFGGLMNCLLTLGSYASVREGIAEMYQQHIDPDEYRNLFEYSGSDFKPDPQRLQPLGDILHSQADLATKRTAIEALAQMECPQSVAVLREALAMESVEVRFFAASVLSKLENRLAAQLKEHDISGETHNFTGYVELAQVYLDYAFFNMVEGKRRIHCLEKALEYTDKAGKISLTPEVLSLSGRILLALERYSEARECFNQYIKTHRESSIGLIWRAEAYLGLRDFASAADDCTAALSIGGVPEKMLPAVEFWANREKAS